MSKTKKTNRKRKPINTYYPVCPICGSELIWGGDHDISEDHEEHDILSNLSCSNKECNAYVEVAWGGSAEIETGVHGKNAKKKKVQYKPGMVSCAGIEHINPDTEEIDFESTVEENYIDPSEEEIDFD